MSCGRWHEWAPACRWQDEPRRPAGASFQVSRPGHRGRRLRGSPWWLPTTARIEKNASSRSHVAMVIRASSCQSCGSFGHRVGKTAPTHCVMPLYRCQTVGSPAAPPESPKWHSSGTRAVLQGGTPAGSGHRRRRWCVGGSESDTASHGIACAPIGSVPLFHKPLLCYPPSTILTLLPASERGIPQ